MPLLVPILLVHSTLGNASQIHGLDLCNKDCSLQSFVGCKYSKSCFCLFSLCLPFSGFGVVPYLSLLHILSAVFPFFVTIRYILANLVYRKLLAQKGVSSAGYGGASLRGTSGPPTQSPPCPSSVPHTKTPFSGGPELIFALFPLLLSPP